jgi:hypothetical protein
MITADYARRIAQRYLDAVYTSEGGRSTVVVADAATAEKHYGWIFMYNTIEYLETEDWRYDLVGNGPILVRREDGAVIEFSSSHTRDSALEAYEQDPTRFPSLPPAL